MPTASPRLAVFSVLLPLVLCVVDARAQAPVVLKDVNPTPGTDLNSDPREFVEFGTRAIFSASSPEQGREAWITDLTTGATAIVADLVPGTGGSDPRGFTVYAGSVFFTANAGGGGRELWRTDGTPAGTSLVLDIAPGAVASNPHDLLVAGGSLFFVVDAPPGPRLWRTDGTPAGTFAVLGASHPAASLLPTRLCVFTGELYFRASSALGLDLWRCDGTDPGTVLVHRAVPLATNPDPVAVVGATLVFGTGSGLYATDGTAAGTSLLASFAPIALASTGTQAYAATGTNGTTIWVTDGTAANTMLVGSLSTLGFLMELRTLGQRGILVVGGYLGGVIACDNTHFETLHSAISSYSLAVVGSQLLFAPIDNNGGVLRRSDGTAAGTAVVGASFGSARELAAMPAAGIALCAGFDLARGNEPRRTDGTAAGSQLVANIAGTAGVTLSSTPVAFVDAAGTAWFGASAGTGSTLWRSDGSAAGTTMVVQPGPGQPQGIGELAAVGTRVFFTASDAQHGMEVWTSDGTAAGTHVVMDAYPGTGGSNPASLVAANDQVFCVANSPAARLLWCIDASNLTATPVTVPGMYTITWQTPLGRGLVFSAMTIGMGDQPYYTDGTASGTVRLSTTVFGPRSFATLGERCFFVNGSENQMWVTDGTPSGTQPFADVSGGGSAYYGRITTVGDWIYFPARSAATGTELWRSDGTVAGTHLVCDATPGPASSSILPILGPMGDVFLYTMAGTNPRQIWRSDGTAAGTFALASVEHSWVTASDERQAFFFGADAAHGGELWRTDGTVAGTGLFADIQPGPTSSYPTQFALSNGRLFFRADHPQLGTEPFVLDVGANAQPVGTACFPSGGGSDLRATAPVLGTTCWLRGRNGPANGIGIVMMSLFTNGAFRFPGGQCDMFVDQTLIVVHAVAPLANGAFDVPFVLPPVPAFAGLPLRAQALLFSVLPTDPIEATNAVALTVGL